MIWECIKSPGVSSIKIDIINAGLVPMAEKGLGDYDDVIFQEDSAPLHRTRLVRIFHKPSKFSSFN